MMGSCLNRGYFATMSNPVRSRLQFIGKPHAHVSVHRFRVSLGMKGDEIQRHRLAVGRALVAEAMLQKCSRNPTDFSDPGPVVAGPPTFASGSAARTPATA